MSFLGRIFPTSEDRFLARRTVLKGLAFILTLLAVGYLIRTAHFGEILDTGWMDAEVRGHGLGGALFFVAVGILFTGVGLPRQIISFLGGYAYGVLLGSGLALAGTILGGILSFYFARFLGRDLVRRFAGGRFQKIDAFLRKNPFTMALVLRFFPVGSNILTNLGAGISSVPAAPFFGGSLLGYIPQTLIFALLGSGLKVDPAWRISLSVVLFLLSVWWGLYLYRKHRNGLNHFAGHRQPFGKEKKNGRGARSGPRL